MRCLTRPHARKYSVMVEGTSIVRVHLDCCGGVNFVWYSQYLSGVSMMFFGTRNDQIGIVITLIYEIHSMLLEHDYQSDVTSL